MIEAASAVKEEIKQCYELINRLGRGVVYLGSSRMGSSHSHYVQAQELANGICLDFFAYNKSFGLHYMFRSWTRTNGRCYSRRSAGRETSWRIKDMKRSQGMDSIKLSPITIRKLPYLQFRFFYARKYGLVDAIVRNNSLDKTAVVTLPGGIGTLDEIYENIVYRK
ncbi:uncharacterized protein LOC123915217 [Trifolium pratense]|uniref:uncharacterized protein LOC123915217 n=1 Tax=Trifolium pratense TaxID=57577 RepID=UPI001E69809E|nr:uncharacterized protein LOC123915217 [Trifolium pratense]